MHLPREAFFAFALCAALSASAATAQTVVNPADVVAREHFMRGRDAFSQGDFASAAREFDQAYQLSRRPQLLYNIGTAYERLHNWNEANVAFRRYLDQVPDAPDRAEVESRLRMIEVELQHQSEALQAPQTNTRVVVVERPVIVQAEPSRPWRTAFFIAGGLTVVTGGVTLAVGLLADARYNDLARGCGQTRDGCRPDDISDMSLRATLVNAGIVATGVFAAATVGTFVLDLLRPQPRPAQGPTVRAGFAPAPGGGLLTLGGTL